MFVSKMFDFIGIQIRSLENLGYEAFSWHFLIPVITIKLP